MRPFPCGLQNQSVFSSVVDVFFSKTLTNLPGPKPGPYRLVLAHGKCLPHRLAWRTDVFLHPFIHLFARSFFIHSLLRQRAGTGRESRECLASQTGIPMVQTRTRGQRKATPRGLVVSISFLALPLSPSPREERAHPPEAERLLVSTRCVGRC